MLQCNNNNDENVRWWARYTLLLGQFIEQGVSPHLQGVYAPLKVLFYVSSEHAQVLESVPLAHEWKMWQREGERGERSGT